MYVCIYVCVCIYMHICVYVCACVYIYSIPMSFYCIDSALEHINL